MNKEGCKGREVKKLIKMQHVVHLIKQQRFKTESTTDYKNKKGSKRKQLSSGVYQNGSDKLSIIRASVKAKHDGEWFTRSLVASI